MTDWLGWGCVVGFSTVVAIAATVGCVLCYEKLAKYRRRCEVLRAQVNSLRHGVVGDHSLSLGALREIEHALRSSGLTEEQAVELVVTGLKAWRATR